MAHINPQAHIGSYIHLHNIEAVTAHADANCGLICLYAIFAV